MAYYGIADSLGYVQLPCVTASSVTLPQGTQFMLIIPEGAAVRWRDDGVNPTAAVGQPLAVGQELTYDAKSAANLKIIQQAATALLNITFYGIK